jgi:hypothetical protein
VTSRLRGAVGSIPTARRVTLLPGRPSPFVTQSQLKDLVKTDSSGIERQIRQAEQMMHHPHRGMSAAPYLRMDDWKRFLCWADGVIQHLEGSRPIPELEHGLTY